MALLLRAAAVAAFLLPLAVAPTSAQNYRGAFGIYGGGSWFSDLNDNGDVIDEVELIDFDGFQFFDIEEFGFADLSLDAGWIAGLQGEYWFGNGRFGLRANGAYTERPFELDFDEGFLLDLDDDGFVDVDFDDTFGDVNVWFGDLDLMLRILRPERDRTLAPFLSLGAGVVHYNPAGDGTVVFPANARIGDKSTEFALVPSIGLDWLPNWSFGDVGLGVRLELADHIAFESPMDPIVVIDGDDDFDAVHNVRLTAGLHALFGELFPPEPVAVAPAPPPPPAPPAEEMITVCVVDPSLPGGIANVQAIYVPSTRDTLVTVNGQRVPLTTAVRDVRVATDTDWYVAGQPLTLTYDAQTAEYVTFGGARIIEPEDLAFLGTVDGVPVYADVDEVRGIQQDLERMAEGGASLEQILRQREDLRDDLEDIEVLYVTLEPIGCVFQPVRRVEEVRKIRG